MLRKILLSIICFGIPFAEAFSLFIYYGLLKDQLKLPSISSPGLFLGTLFFIFILKNFFIYIKSSKQKLEKIILSSLIVGTPGILIICYFLFYYFPFVHTPQGMGTVIQIYFFIAFVFFIFVLRKIVNLLISKLKHPLKKTLKLKNT